MQSIMIQSVKSPRIHTNCRNRSKRPLLEIFIKRSLAHSSHFAFRTSTIVIYFQKSPVERGSQQLNDQKAQKPVFRNTIANFFARL